MHGLDVLAVCDRHVADLGEDARESELVRLGGAGGVVDPGRLSALGGGPKGDPVDGIIRVRAQPLPDLRALDRRDRRHAEALPQDRVPAGA